jgi:ABC-type glycerol-3-phosphate transport system permease component
MSWFGKAMIYFMLGLCGLTMIVPFLWMITTSLKSQAEVNKGHVGFMLTEEYDGVKTNVAERVVKIVKRENDSVYVHVFDDDGKIIRPYWKVASADIHHRNVLKLHWSNYSKAFKKVPFALYFYNSILCTVVTTIGVIITSALAAYAFARMRFFGRDTLFYIFLSMMMVPEPVYLIPSYILLNHLGWIDTYQALIIPWLASVFTIFLMRQHFMTIPQDLFDAASIDGCSRFGMLWRVVLPLSKPVIATAAVFTAISSWNSFIWPLVMTNSPELRVIQVGLSYFSQESSSQTTLLMAASSFSIMPLVVLFVLAQKQIIASFASSGMKN